MNTKNNPPMPLGIESITYKAIGVSEYQITYKLDGYANVYSISLLCDKDGYLSVNNVLSLLCPESSITTYAKSVLDWFSIVNEQTETQ